MSNSIGYWVVIISTMFGICATLGGFIYWFGNKAGTLESQMKYFSNNMDKNSEIMKTFVTKNDFEKELMHLNKRIDEINNRFNDMWQKIK